MCLCSTVHRCLVRMPWWFLLLPLSMSMVAVVDSGKRLPPVHWNSSNPMFLISNNDHVIDVHEYDMLEIVCPKYDENTPEYQREYYTVYMVKKSEYNACTIYNRTEARLIVNCTEPTQTRMFSLLIRSFGSVPHMPDFQAGNTYYFISTSTGRPGGITNQLEGACLHQGMKMMLRVCCSSTQSTRTLPGRGTTPHSEKSKKTTLRTTRRTTPRPTTTTKPPTQPPTTTKKSKPPDYKTREEELRAKELEKPMPDIINDMSENSGLINSKSSSSEISLSLLTFLLLFCLFR